MDYNKIEATKGKVVDVTEERLVEKEKPQRVVSGKVKKKKKNLIERLVVGIIGPDGLPAIGSYLMKEVIGPSLLQLTAESLKSGIDMMAYRNHGGPPVHNPMQPTRMAVRPQTNYSNRYTTAPTTVAPSATPMQPTRAVRTRVEDYIIPDRSEAYAVVQSLQAMADAYNVVSLFDYYGMIGADTEYTDYNFGWDAASISQISLMPVAGGYVIKFPPVQALK